MWDDGRTTVVVAESIADPETFSARNARSLIQLRQFDVPSFPLCSSLSLFLSLSLCMRECVSQYQINSVSPTEPVCALVQ